MARGHRSVWFPLLSACRFVEFDTCIICHVLVYCFLVISIARYIFKSPRVCFWGTKYDVYRKLLPPYLGEIIECRCLFSLMYLRQTLNFFSHILIQLYLFVRSSCHCSKRRQLMGPLGHNSYTPYSSDLFTSFQVEPLEYSASWVITCQTKLLVSLIWYM